MQIVAAGLTLLTLLALSSCSSCSLIRETMTEHAKHMAGLIQRNCELNALTSSKIG